VNIYQRINEVRKAISKVAKDKKVESYMAVTHDQVTALTRDHFVEHGIVFVPRILSERTVNTGTFTSRDTPFVRYEATYAFDVVNVEDPKDMFTAVIGAHAIDHGDKAPGKALSYAKKALILKLLELESVSDEEGRQEQHKPKGASAATHDAFAALPKERQRMIVDTATQVVDYLREERNFDAYALCESITDVDEKLALWSRFDSKQRSAIKKQSELEKAKH
jgi:hypothetical protein